MDKASEALFAVNAVTFRYNVTVGDGSGRGAALSPGMDADSLFTLTMQSELTFNSDGTYRFGLNSRAGRADRVVVKP